MNVTPWLRRLFVPILGLALFASCSESVSRSGEHVGHAAAARYGTVDFPVSCNDAARPHMHVGLAQLHNMMYEDAEIAFAEATGADPDCSLGYWGQAMTYIHPLWSDPPTAEEFDKGKGLLSEARARGKKTEREQAYVAALAAYFETQADDEAPRLKAFAAGWRKAHEAFPDDLEAAALYAVALLGTASPKDKTYAVQKEAGAIAERVLARIPDHPGGHHYVIHAYDYPPLAEKALAVARSYGKIAPEVAHPLHMPSHIFTRLGYWQESIEWNKRSAAAAASHGEPMVGKMHHVHALDYLTYAYLQGAEDGRAKKVVDDLMRLEAPFPAHPAAAYAIAAGPARYALERQQWADAAALEPRKPAAYAWDKAPEFEAITHFARGLGAARSGNTDVARQAWTRLGELHDAIPGTGSRAYWKNQVAIQRKAVEGWLRLAEGKRDAALKAMAEATAMERATEKHPVTPGEILPASELYGDMLLAVERPAEALAAYRTALDRSPKRFNSLYGAGKAAAATGDMTAAAGYNRELLEVTASADTQRPQLAEVRAATTKKTG